MPTARTGDVETYYERRGDGPPIVFVHGAVLDHRQWAPQLDALSDDYTVVAYDVRGHGRTGGSARHAYSVDLLADDLAALVDALELDRPVICGLSLGGCIAQAYAARYPDRLAALVLADTFTPTPLSLGERAQRSLVPRLVIPPVRLLGYPRVERALVWIQERLSGPEVSGDYGRVQRLREEGSLMSTAEFAKVMRVLDGYEETAIDYGAITVPVLVLYGEHDVPFVRRQARRLRDLLPHAAVRPVPGAGHAANLDNPAFLTRAIREFLTDYGVGPAAEPADATGANGSDAADADAGG